MIKKIFAIFIMANLVLNVNSAICSSIGYFTVSVVGSDIDIIPIPVNRAPARKGKIVCAVYNSDDEVLYISFMKNISNGCIYISCNGIEVLNEALSLNSGETVSYDLSGYSYGEYEICITTSNDETYIGTFSKVAKD